MLQHSFAIAAGLGSESIFLIAIAVLACVLGAEIAGICILIGKMRRARIEQIHTDGDHSSQNYAAAVFLFGSATVAAQIALLVLAVCTAAAALVLAILLIVFRAKGYFFVAVKNGEKEAESNAVQPSKNTSEETFEDAVATEEDEPDDETEAEEVAFVYSDYATGDEDATLTEQADEPFALEDDGETKADVPASATVTEAVPAQSAAVPEGIPVYSSAYPGGQYPYVEKHITETYKEIIRETNTTTNSSDRTNEELLKAIAELMKLGTELRTEREMAVTRPAAQQKDAADAFAEADEDEIDADEPDDEDEIESADATAEGEEGDDEYESDLFSGNERIVGFDEETGCYIVAHYRKSFEAKLIQARPEVKKYYSRIKNALFGYEGTKDRITWTINNFTNEHTQIAKINVRSRTLDLYLALDPATLEDSVYHGKDVGEKKKYADTPFLFKVNSARKLTLALELVQRACEEQGLSPIDAEEVRYEEQYPFETTESLIARGLIREYLREEKPAVTFELDPDHVPQVPEEDESVIPVNANFTWEFDNEQAVEPEPTAEEESTSEAPAPVIEAIVSAVSDSTVTTTTTHETVKTTERHYTERYYGVPAAPQPTAELSNTMRTIEVLAEPADEADEPVAEEISSVADETVADEVMVDEHAVEEDETEEIYEDVEEDETEEIYEDVEEDETEEVYEDVEEDETEEIYEDVEEDETEEIYEDVEEDETEENYEDVEEDENEEIYEDVEEDENEEIYEDVEEDETEEIYEDVEEDETEEIYEDAEEELYEEVDEEEADEEEAPASASVAPQPIPSGNPDVALLDVCLFDDYFENGAVVNLETLKQVGLAPESATRLKVYAGGPLKGQFTVEANHFTLDAIKAIGDADGDAIMIR